MKKIYFLLRIISFCLMSIFLTFVLDQDTLTTTLQCFFIFGYFLMMLLILDKFFFLKHCITDKKNVLYALVGAVILSCGLGENYLPQKDVESIVRIEVQNKKNEDSQGYEVWIRGLKRNNHIVNINDYITHYSNYENRDNLILMLGEQQPEYIELKLSSVYQYTLMIGKHAWSGIINIYLDNDLYKQYDLYSEDGKEMNIILPVNKYEWNMIYLSILALGRYLLIFYCILILLSYIKIKQYLNSKNCFILYIFMLAYYFKYNVIYNSFVLYYTVSFLLWNHILKNRTQCNVKNYLKKIPIGLILINIYITFSFVGASIFLPLHKTEIYLSDLLCFFIWYIIIFPFSYLLVLATEKYMYKEKGGKEKNVEINKHYKSLYVIPIIIMGIVLCILNPGLMTPDSFDQYAQAHGLFGFSDHHPIFHTFVEALLYKIYDSPMTIAIAQILFFSFVYGQIGNYFIKNGYRKSIIFIFIALVSILPMNIINMITLWKDIPFSIAILYMTYLLARISVEKDKFFTILNSFSFGVALTMVAFFRHNGLIISIIGIVYVVLVILKKKIFWKMIIPAIYIGTIVLIKIGLPIYLNASPNGNVITVVPLHGIAYVNYVKGLDDLQTAQILENYMPLEEWKNLYNPSTADTYMYTPTAIEYHAMDKYRSTEIKPILESYMRNLKKNPYLILKDRLYGTDLLWNICEASYSYNSRHGGFYEEGYQQYNIVHKRTYLENMIFGYVGYSYKYKILDSLLWRVGIYLDLILLLIYVIIRNKKYHKLIVFIPVILNTMALFLAMAWQDYRYVYYIFMTFGFLWLYTLKDCENIIKQY